MIVKKLKMFFIVVQKMTSIQTNYIITLHRDSRVMEIGENGNLRMEKSNGTNGTKLEMRIEIEEYDMRQNIGLYFNGKKMSFQQPKKEDDVRIIEDGIQPYIIEKEQFSQNIIALTNDRFGEFALDDYQGNKPGPIKWWNMWKDNKTGQHSIKPNQWFSVSLH